MPVFATGAAKAATDDIAPSSAAKMINSISSLPRKVKKAIYSKKEEKKEEKEPGDEVMALAILPLEWNGNQVAIQCLVSEDGALNGAVYSWKKEEKKKKNTIEGIELALSDSLQKKEDHMKVSILYHLLIESLFLLFCSNHNCISLSLFLLCS